MLCRLLYTLILGVSCGYSCMAVYLNYLSNISLYISLYELFCERYPLTRVLSPRAPGGASAKLTDCQGPAPLVTVATSDTIPGTVKPKAMASMGTRVLTLSGRDVLWMNTS